MIRITSNTLGVQDRDLIKKFCYFALKVLVPKGKKHLISKTDILIKFSKPGKEIEGETSVIGPKARAWCRYEGTKNGRKKFIVVISESYINKRAKKDYYRLKGVFLYLAHELTHAKQYMTGELYDYADGGVRWRKERLEYNQDDWYEYYDSPWEIEAFGREWGLFKLFKIELLKERKGK